MDDETYELNGQHFVWDREKNLSNIEKHGFTFKVAAQAFLDQNAVLYEDEGHSTGEDRFILIGLNKKDNLLTVCHCYRGRYENKTVTRIFSARKATKKEKHRYGGA